MKTLKQSSNHGTAGFSLAELTIVVVILGVLSTMAVPRYQGAVERAKASEAFTYLSQIEHAQDRQNARTGFYAKKLSDLDIQMVSPEHFEVGDFSSYNWQTQWQMRLTRQGASSGFGAYTVTWNQDGFLRSRSSISDALISIQ